jgi:hypothetical protein
VATPSASKNPFSQSADPVQAVKDLAAQNIESHPVRHWRALIFQAYLFFATIAFSILVVFANMFNYFPIDLRITRAVQTIHTFWFASLMEWVSAIGYMPQMPVLIVVVFLLLFVIGLRWEAVVTFGAAVGSASLAGIIKTVVHRLVPALIL